MMTEPASDSSTVLVIDDLPCGTCGYNLRTLNWAAICPECGKPVRESRLLPGFRFSGLQAARRLRTVLALLVVATLVGAFAQILTTLSYRFFFQIGRPFAAWGSLYVPSHAPAVVSIILFAAICLLQRPMRNTTIGHRSLLPRVTLGVGGVTVVVYLADSASSRPFGLGAGSWAAGVISFAYTPAVIGSIVALILVWTCLLRLVDRTANRFLWRATATAIVLAGVGALPRLMIVICFVGWQLAGGSSLEDAWWEVLGRLYEPCRRFFGTPCIILMMLVVWAYLCKLDTARRALIDSPK